MKQVLIVRNLQTRESVHEVDVTGKSEQAIERVMRGMLINMSPEYYIDDSEAYAKEVRR